MSVAAKPAALWSRRALGEEFEIDPRRVTSLLREVQPAGKLAGRDAYRLRDVAFVLAAHKAGVSTTPVPDAPVAAREPEEGEPTYLGIPVNDLEPKSRKDWFDGENRRIEILEKTGELIPKARFIDVVGNITKAVKATLLTLGDVLERDAGLAPDQVVAADRVARELLTGLAADVAQAARENDEAGAGAR